MWILAEAYATQTLSWWYLVVTMLYAWLLSWALQQKLKMLQDDFDRLRNRTDRGDKLAWQCISRCDKALQRIDPEYRMECAAAEEKFWEEMEEAYVKEKEEDAQREDDHLVATLKPENCSPAAWEYLRTKRKAGKLP